MTMLAYAPRVKKYATFSILKKNGRGTRNITAPTPLLKKVQKKLAIAFESVYNPPECVHGFVPQRSIVTNAVQHVGKPAIVEIDLCDFFPSITANRIHGLLRKYPFRMSEEVINTITQLVCYQGALPQGAPSSPVLSNMICLKMDKRLMGFAKDNKLRYSRYADDITFSSSSRYSINAAIDESSEFLVAQDLVEIIEKNGFRINQSKSRIARKSARQTVNGIIVNKKCNFPREDYRELRVVFHNWEKYGVDYAADRYLQQHRNLEKKLCDASGALISRSFVRHIRGRLEYYSMVTRFNRHPSVPLTKLWSMYWKQTYETTPSVMPECGVVKTECAYDCYDNRLMAESGTAFKLDNGTVVTCKHCLCTGCLQGIPDNAIVEISFGKISFDIMLSEWSISSKIDAALVPDAKFSFRAGLRYNSEYRLQIGETVTAYGFADGKDELRKIEATVAEIINGNQYRVNRAYIHGMSGGPVLNSRNEVVGMVVRGSAAHDYAYDGEFLSIKAILEDKESLK